MNINRKIFFFICFYQLFLSGCGSSYPIKVSEILTENPVVVILYNGIPIMSENGKGLDILLKEKFLEKYPSLRINILAQFDENGKLKYFKYPGYDYLFLDKQIISSSPIFIIFIDSKIDDYIYNDIIKEKDSNGNVIEKEDLDNYTKEKKLTISIIYYNLKNSKEFKSLKNFKKYDELVKKYPLNEKSYQFVDFYSSENACFSGQYVSQILENERTESTLVSSLLNKNNLLTNILDIVFVLSNADQSVKRYQYAINSEKIVEEFTEKIKEELYLIKNKKKYYDFKWY
ncbi:MAG: hypothetical protein A2Y41_09300 [Spirochaetes bacterium GWB1_36_13]|nr:MAG: hypothetical protein A2Y41_09300 [Spirochaetes bacterium GWB1_36_13]